MIVARCNTPSTLDDQQPNDSGSESDHSFAASSRQRLLFGPAGKNLPAEYRQPCPRTYRQRSDLKHLVPDQANDTQKLDDPIEQRGESSSHWNAAADCSPRGPPEVAQACRRNRRLYSRLHRIVPQRHTLPHAPHPSERVCTRLGYTSELHEAAATGEHEI